MKISTKGTYALRIMTDIALAGENNVTVSNLASTTNISEKYLEQIVGKLAKAKLLKSYRGTNGGYQLSKPPKEISLKQILQATEGSFKSVSCLEDGAKCDMQTRCLTVSVWAGLNKVINDYLSSVSLEDVIKKNIKISKKS